MTSDAEFANEIAARGETIYREQIKDLVEDAHHGKFVIIDVDTGDYEIDKRDALASKRLLERRPEGVLYGIRIGFRAAYRMGWKYRLPDND